MELHTKKQMPVLTNRQTIILYYLLDYVFSNIHASLPMNVVGEMQYDISPKEVEDLTLTLKSCIYLQKNIDTFDPSRPRPYCITGNQTLFLYHLMKRVVNLAQASMPLNLLVVINQSFSHDDRVSTEETAEIMAIFEKKCQ